LPLPFERPLTSLVCEIEADTLALTEALTLAISWLASLSSIAYG